MLARIVNNNDLILENLTTIEEDAVMERFTVVQQSRFANPDAGGFNGVYKRYDRARRRLARPFLGELRALCAKEGMPIVVRDDRPAWKYNVLSPDDVGPDFLPGITLEEYQLRSIKVGCKVECCIFDIPTGGGKTEVMAGLCKAIQCPTVILADQRIVIDQIKQRLELRDVIDEVGLFYAGQTPTDQLIIAGSVQSLQIPSRVPPPPQESDSYAKAKSIVAKDPAKYGLEPNSDKGDFEMAVNTLADKIQKGAMKKHESVLKGFRKRKARAKQFQEIVKKAEMIIVDECVDVNSYIATDEGMIRAGSLHERIKAGSKFRAMVGGRRHRITASKLSTRDGCLEIRTHTGRSLVTSPEHRYMLLRDGTLVQEYAKRIGPTDLLLVSRHDCRVSHGRLDYRWYGLGLFIGDGHRVNGTQVKFGVRRDVSDWRTAIAKVSASFGGNYSESINQRGDTTFRIRSAEFCGWLESLGFKPGRKMGSIDPKFDVPGRDEAISLLRGLFDAEGSCYENRVSFGTIDRPLASFMQSLLSYLGIESTVMVGNYRSNVHHAKLWRLLVCGENYTRFMRIVGFGFDRKNRGSQYSNVKDSNRLVDPTPVVRKWLSSGITARKLCAAIGASPAHLYRDKISLDRLCKWQASVSLLSRSRCSSYAEAKMLFGTSISEATWQDDVGRIAAALRVPVIDAGLADYAVESVVSNVPVGVRDVVDFTVDSAEMFEANGILVHNCDLAGNNNQYKYVFRHLFKGRRRYGFSGTPFDPEKPVDALFVQEHLGSVMVKIERRELEERGRIIPIEYIMFALGNTPTEASAFDIATNEKMVQNEEFHRIIKAICNQYSGEGKNERTLVLVERDALGEALVHLIPGAVFIHGKTQKRRRDEVLRAFERKEIRVVIGGKIIRRGLDLKGGCENLVIATGGKLWSTLNQQVGRAVRVNERGFGRIFDFLLLYNKYLYRHSRARLRSIVDMGYKTKVVFPDGHQVAGDKFVASGFRRTKPRTQIGRRVGIPTTSRRPDPTLF